VSAVEIAVDVAGWTGAALILGGYVLVTAGRVTGQSPLFQWMNVAGAIGFIINGWWHRALPSAVLNVIWAAIGLMALWKIARSGSSTSAM
jgi:hypothetical protein